MRHHASDHETIANKLLEAKIAAQELFVEHHNGDDKLNKRIMAVRDTIMEATILVTQHKIETAQDDNKIKQHGYFIKIFWAILMAGIGVATHFITM